MRSPSIKNIFSDLPQNLDMEFFESIIRHEGVKIERIISKGHTTPMTQWYDQAQHEWVMVLQGEAILAFDNQDSVRLRRGDYLNIPAHQKHRVEWTIPDQETIWLAIFY